MYVCVFIFHTLRHINHETTRKVYRTYADLVRCDNNNIPRVRLISHVLD